MQQASDILIGLDAGTDRIEAVAFDGDGCEIQAVSTASPVALLEHGAEQDLGDSWQAAAQALRQLASSGPGPCPADRGAGDHRSERRHLADRRGRRSGGASMARSRPTGAVDRRALAADRARRQAAGDHRGRRRQRALQRAARLAAPASARGRGARRDRVQRQGLVVFLLHRRAGDRSRRRRRELRQPPHPRLRPGGSAAPEPAGGRAAAAGDHRRDPPPGGA